MQVKRVIARATSDVVVAAARLNRKVFGERRRIDRDAVRGVAVHEPNLHGYGIAADGALLQGSVMMGAACGNPTQAEKTALETYGAAMGLAFQVVDDILDVTSDSATLGKTAGKDALHDKPTYVSILGLLLQSSSLTLDMPCLLLVV